MMEILRCNHNKGEDSQPSSHNTDNEDAYNDKKKPQQKSEIIIFTDRSIRPEVSYKKRLFLNISPNSQGNTFVGVSFSIK